MRFRPSTGKYLAGDTISIESVASGGRYTDRVLFGSKYVGLPHIARFVTSIGSVGGVVSWTTSANQLIVMIGRPRASAATALGVAEPSVIISVLQLQCP